MIKYYLSELGIYEESLPKIFNNYEEILFQRWRTLSYFLVKDVLTYMSPFILQVERVTFRKSVMDKLFTLLDSWGCLYLHFSIEEAALALISFYTQTPEICVNSCCFLFDTSNIKSSRRMSFLICSNTCGEQRFRRDPNSMTKFDAWVRSKSVRICNIELITEEEDLDKFFGD